MWRVSAFRQMFDWRVKGTHWWLWELSRFQFSKKLSLDFSKHLIICWHHSGGAVSTLREKTLVQIPTGRGWLLYCEYEWWTRKLFRMWPSFILKEPSADAPWFCTKQKRKRRQMDFPALESSSANLSCVYTFQQGGFLQTELWNFCLLLRIAQSDL